MKAFSAVEFGNGKTKSHSVVPTKWLFEKRNVTYCRWPSQNLDALVKNLADADAKWQVHQITEILAASSKPFVFCLYS